MLCQFEKSVHLYPKAAPVVGVCAGVAGSARDGLYGKGLVNRLSCLS